MKSDQSTFRRVDVLERVSLLTCLILLFLGLNFGRTEVSWINLFVATMLPLSVIPRVAFLYIENDAKEPITLVEFLLRGSVWFADLTRWFATMVRSGLPFCGPT